MLRVFSGKIFRITFIGLIITLSSFIYLSPAQAINCDNVNADNKEGEVREDKGDKGTKEPVNLANGNLFFETQDFYLPGRGLSLDLTRHYNTQVTTEFPLRQMEAGSWTIEDGELSGEGDRLTTMNWRHNVRIQVKMKTIDSLYGENDVDGPKEPWYVAWINFRYGDIPPGQHDPTNYYRFLIKKDGLLELVKVKDCVTTFLVQQSSSYDPYDWHDIDIRVDKGLIHIFIDGTEEITYSDTNYIPSGKVSLCAYWCQAHFDDFKISAYSETPGPPPTVYLEDDFNRFSYAEEAIFGYGWTHTYGMKIAERREPNTLLVYRPDGRKDIFVEDPPGGGSYKGPTGCYDILTKTSTGYQLREKNGTQYLFDLEGKLTSIKDRNERQITLSYDGSGKLITVTDDSARSLNFSYGPNGKVNQVTDPEGRSVSYQYDSAGNLIFVTDPMGYATEYSYYPNHNMKIRTNKEGDTFSYTYYYADRCATQTDPLGEITTFTYIWERTEISNVRGELYTYGFYQHNDCLNWIQDAEGNSEGYNWYPEKNLNSFDDKNGDRRTTYLYDSLGNRTQITNFKKDESVPGGLIVLRFVVFTYEPNFSRMTSYRDYMGRMTHYDYDAHGNLVEVRKYPAWLPPNITKMSYNAFGNLMAMEDTNGNITLYQYDSYGNRSKVIDAKGNETQFTYDILSRLTATTDARGNTTTYEYDNNDNLIKVTDAPGNITRYNYDKMGNLIALTDANGQTTTYEYDALGNLIKITDPLGNTTQYTYDGVNFMHLGLCIRTSSTDAKGNTAYYEYDKTGRLIKVTDAKGGETNYEYDPAGNLICLTDANGNATSYEYDTFNQLVKVTDPMGNITAYAYDNNGNRTARTDANGNLTSFWYDQLDRLMWTVYPGYNRVDRIFDNMGNVTQIKKVLPSGISITNYTYDTLNRIVQVNFSTGQTISYTYDALGSRAGMTTPVGNTTYEYDSLNRLINLTAPDGKTTQFRYDQIGRRLKTVYPNGSFSEYNYDQANRLLSLINQRDDASLISQFNYTYDPEGNRLTMEDNEGTHSYQYDPLNQLLQVRYPDGKETGYEYGPVGNRLTITDLSGTTNYSYDEANRLLEAGNSIFSYDNNGNVIEELSADGRKLQFSYDYENRLEGLEVSANLVKLKLTPGWNFISLSLIPVDSSVLAVLSALSFGTDYDQVSRFNPETQTWEHWVNNETYNQFDTMEYGRGYAIYVTNPSGVELEISGTEPVGGESIGIEAGWNLVGTPALMNVPVNSVLSGLQFNVDYDYVAGYNKDTDSYNVLSQNGYMEWGSSYFVFGLKDTILLLPPALNYANYAYDGEGRRITKDLAGKVTAYFYDFNECVFETDALGNILKSYVHGPRIDEIVAEVRHPTPEVRFLYYDGLGSVCNLTDNAGIIQTSYSYDVYGALRRESGVLGNDFLFTGRRIDPEAGLYYYRARHYAPKVGRFIQQDKFPFDGYNPQTIHRYIYVSNNPVNWVDPWGWCGEKKAPLWQKIIDIHEEFHRGVRVKTKDLSRGERVFLGYTLEIGGTGLAITGAIVAIGTLGTGAGAFIGVPIGATMMFIGTETAIVGMEINPYPMPTPF